MRRISGPFLFAGLLIGCCLFTYTSPRDASHAKSIMSSASRTTSSLHRHSQTPIPTDMEVEPNITPAVTLDLSCTDYDCLQTCMEHLPELVGFLDPGTPADTETSQGSQISGAPIPVGIYELALYAVKDGKFKRTHAPEVPERLQGFQDDAVLHRKIWDYFVEIVPESVLSMVTSFSIYTDGQGVGTAMQAFYNPPYHYLSIDLFDLGDTPVMTSSLIHEAGHLVTINKSQIKHMIDWPFNTSVDWESFQLGQKECGYIYSTSNCAIPGSYLDLFYNRFWKERHNYQIYLINHAFYYDQDMTPIASQLFNEYPDEFLNLYAATNMNEDVAVSFERFVLGPKPEEDRIADQKLLFFYEFPELVVFREQVIQNICDYAATH
jgi:hypothetical protein